MTGAFAPVVATDVVAFGAGVAAGEAGITVVVVRFVAGGAAAPGAVVEPAELVPLPGVGVAVAAGAAGSVVIGVGTGGKGFDITVAIISFKPSSDLL